MATITSGFGRTFKRVHAQGVARGNRSTLTDMGILDSMFNMTCEDGHRSYSPTPESWLDGLCQARLERGFCTRRIVRMEDSLG